MTISLTSNAYSNSDRASLIADIKTALGVYMTFVDEWSDATYEYLCYSYDFDNTKTYGETFLLLRIDDVTTYSNCNASIATAFDTGTNTATNQSAWSSNQRIDYGVNYIFDSLLSPEIVGVSIYEPGSTSRGFYPLVFRMLNSGFDEDVYSLCSCPQNIQGLNYYGPVNVNPYGWSTSDNNNCYQESNAKLGLNQTDPITSEYNIYRIFYFSAVVGGSSNIGVIVNFFDDLVLGTNKVGLPVESGSNSFQCIKPLANAGLYAKLT